MTVKQFVAIKAFIERDGKVLVLREASSYDEGTNEGRFDVCGGRLAPGEHWQDALEREIAEETGLSVTVGAPFAMGEWRPVVHQEQWQVVAVFVRCQAHPGEVILGPDHNAFRWIEPADHEAVPLMENLHAIFKRYCKPQRS